MKYPRKVYAIRHNTTNKVYIGSSCNVDRRFLQHLYALRSHGHPVADMQKDFDEHGEDYTMTILDTIKDASESEKEYKWMETYQSFVPNTGYNYQDMKVRQQGKDVAAEDALVTEREDLTTEERSILGLLKKLRDKKATVLGVVMLLSGIVVSFEKDNPCNPDKPDCIA